MAEDFQATARRTYVDAQMLHQTSRLPTADHLYGLASECALKAILEINGFLKPGNIPNQWRKHIDTLWDEYGSLQHGRQMPTLGSNPFKGWKVADRYEPDHIFDIARVSSHATGAEEAIRALQEALEP